jgi:tripeptide aminopeptidase
MTRNYRPWRRGNGKSNTRSRRNVTALPASAGSIVGKTTGVEVTQTTKVHGVYTSYKGWYEQTMTKDYTAVNPMDKNLLFLTMSVQSESRATYWMEKFILRFCEKLINEGQEISCSVDKVGNIYVTKGVSDLYPTMVAHTDTVHDIVPSREYQVRSDRQKMWAVNPKTGQDQGIGGDDKVGIFVALSLLRELPVFKAAFFVDEEIGCVGSRVADMTFFEDSSLVLQCDRKGTSDFVDNIMGTPLYGEGFAQEIEPLLTQFGYKSGDGGMTDVWQLKENGLNVACANMSSGYFRPHTRWEYVGLNDVQRCYDLCFAVVTQLGDKRWEHLYDEADNSWNTADYTSDEQAYYEYWVGQGAKQTTGRNLYQDDYWFDQDRLDKARMGQDTIGKDYLNEEDANVSRAVDALKQKYPHLEIGMGATDATYGITERSVSQILENDRALLQAQQDYMEWEGREEAERTPACPECGSTITVMNDDEGGWWCVGCDIPVTIDVDFDIIDGDDETEMPEVIVRGSVVRLHA